MKQRRTVALDLALTGLGATLLLVVYVWAFGDKMFRRRPPGRK